MKPEVVLVTPKIAEQWLKKNDGNRPISERTLREYTKMMLDGQWKDKTGDAVCFNCDGTLIDGQHRLKAISESGKSYSMVVVRGVAKDVFMVKDAGKKRSISDALGIMGEKYYVCLAAAGTMLFKLTAGRSTKWREGVTAELIAATIANNPGLRDSVEIARTMFKGKRVLAPATIACLHFLFALKDQQASDDFFSKVLEGENLDRNSPEFALRDRLLKNMMATSKLPPHHLAVFTIKAWNARRKGQRIGAFRFTEGEEVPAIL